MVTHLEQGTHLTTLLVMAGLRSAEALDRVLPFVSKSLAQPTAVSHHGHAQHFIPSTAGKQRASRTTASMVGERTK